MVPFLPVAGLRPFLATMPEYVSLEDPYEVAARFGVDPAHVIKIDGNENPFGPAPRALEALRNIEYQPEWYGDDNQVALRAAVAP